MPLTQNQYLRIRDILIHIGCHPPRLERLKSAFRNDINSQRTFERIDSLNGLFRILERRDVLGPEHSDNLNRVITEVAPDNYEIQNILQPQAPIRNFWPAAAPDNDRVLPPVLPDPIQRINQMVKAHIGLSWRELARGFSIPEGQIVNLDQRYQRDIERIAHEILVVHRERCGEDGDRWRVGLQNALRFARRQDLSDDIDDILARNPIRRG